MSDYLGTAKAKWRQQSLAVSVSATAPGTSGQMAYGCTKPAASAQPAHHSEQTLTSPVLVCGGVQG